MNRVKYLMTMIFEQTHQTFPACLSLLLLSLFSRSENIGRQASEAHSFATTTTLNMPEEGEETLYFKMNGQNEAEGGAHPLDQKFPLQSGSPPRGYLLGL